MEKNNCSQVEKSNVQTTCTCQTINKTYAKFQKDETKIVGEVNLTKYPLIASEMLFND